MLKPLEELSIYTKGGAVGVYSGLLVLVPDYDFGCVILSGNTLGTAYTGQDILRNLIADASLLAVEAATVLAGTYKAANGLNSSITIVVLDSTFNAGLERTFTSIPSDRKNTRNSLSVRLYTTNLLQILLP